MYCGVYFLISMDLTELKQSVTELKRKRHLLILDLYIRIVNSDKIGDWRWIGK